jgi:hypothetical protein
MWACGAPALVNSINHKYVDPGFFLRSIVRKAFRSLLKSVPSFGAMASW